MKTPLHMLSCTGSVDLGPSRFVFFSTFLEPIFLYLPVSRQKLTETILSQGYLFKLTQVLR